MSKGKKVTIGYKYYLGMHQVLCHGPIDSVKRITADDKVLWSGTAAGGAITISKPTIFGGDEREGGVSGNVDVELGGRTQGVNSYLASKLGALTPAFRGVAALVLRQVYLGNSAYPKPWVVRASRINARTDGTLQWYSSKAAIGEDMNPAHILVECLTNGDWGMGYNSSDLDLTAFQSAADTLYTEGMGISILWDKSASLEEFIQEILSHIDGSLFVDRPTGLFTLKLARGGYDTNSLLVLNEDNVEEISDLKRSTQDELYNSVTVTYWDSSTGKDGSVTVSDIAMVAQQGHTIGEKLDFPGFTNGTIANKVAMRELKALSTPLLRCSIIANREAAGLNVADVFKLNWPRYGITNVVMRVASIELGSSTDLSVRIECVEDVFALGEAVYSAPPATGWTDVSSDPSAMPYRSVVEAPYFDVARVLGDAQAQALPVEMAYVMATGSRPTSDALNADLMTNPTNTAYVYAANVDFCPVAELASDVSKISTVWSIVNDDDMESVELNTYAVIGSEVVSIIAKGTGTITVGRGVLDTIPITHAAGSRIFFAEDFYQFDQQEYATGEVARIRMLPTTANGTLALASAPENSVTMAARLSRPYPPANIKVNAESWPTSVTGAMTITWANRNRLAQTAGTHVTWYDSSIAIESGATTNLTLSRYLNGSLVPVLASTGLTGTSVAPVPDREATYLLEMETVKNGLVSSKKYSETFDYTFKAPGDYTPTVLSVTHGTTVSGTTHTITLPTRSVGDFIQVFIAFSGPATITPPSGWSVFSYTNTAMLTVSSRTLDGTETSTISFTSSVAVTGAYSLYRIEKGTFRVVSTNSTLRETNIVNLTSGTTASVSLTPVWERNSISIAALALSQTAAPTVTYSLPNNNNMQQAGTAVGLATMSGALGPGVYPAPANFSLSEARTGVMYHTVIRGKFNPDVPEPIHHGAYSPGSPSTAVVVSSAFASAYVGDTAIVIACGATNTTTVTLPSGWTNLSSAAGMRVMSKTLVASDIGANLTVSFSTSGYHNALLYVVQAANFGGAISCSSIATGSGTNVTVPSFTANASFTGRKNTVIAFYKHPATALVGVPTYPQPRGQGTFFNTSPSGVESSRCVGTVTGEVVPAQTFVTSGSVDYNAVAILLSGPLA